MLVAGELGYSMALRGDLPRALARTRRGNTPVVAQAVASAVSILLVMANMSRETAGLLAFVALLATSATLRLYLAGAVVALKLRPCDPRRHAPRRSSRSAGHGRISAKSAGTDRPVQPAEVQDRLANGSA